MRSSSVPSSAAHRSVFRFRKLFLPSPFLPRAAALSLLAVYLITAVAAYNSTLRPGSLSLEIGLCGDTPCVSSVTPGGLGWFFGAKPGMAVLSVNGRRLAAGDTGIIAGEPIKQAQLLTPERKILQLPAIEDPIGQSPMKFSLWVLGGMFALLGAAVVLRRPDLHTARVFWLFTGSMALALAVGPSSVGPGPAWARILQALSLVCIGSFFLPLVFALTRENGKSQRSLVVAIFVSFGVVLIAGYGVSLLFRPSIYQLVRPMVFVYISASVLGGLGLLAVEGTRQRLPARRQQARIALGGIALGTLPFIGFSLIPNALGMGSLLPLYITILVVGLMPFAFAYAILQHQLLGIRRLVHRGMVYGTTTVLLLVLITLSLTALVRLSGWSTENGYPQVAIAGILIGGILLFFPLRRGARWLVDELIYRDVVDYRTALAVLHRELPTPGQTGEVAALIVRRLAYMLHLESVLLFLVDDQGHSQLAAAAGERAEEALRQIHPQFESDIHRSENLDVLELRWQSDFLLLASLVLSGRYLGYMLLGPKERGEIFLEEEKQLITSMIPVLALAIDKSELSEELRALNQRLVKAQEGERARIAGDLHDGPLQKVMILARATGTSDDHRQNIAREVVAELREISSRLRPAILDDLGLIPALEWLTEDVARRFGFSARLSTHGVSDEERFSSDIELALFRIAQEAANNAVKHSKGTSVEVSLAKEGDSLMLRVEDNGTGFSLASRLRSGSGLSGMRERVLQVSGFFEIHPVPGLGTTLTARVPLTGQQDASGS